MRRRRMGQHTAATGAYHNSVRGAAADIDQDGVPEYLL